MLERAQTIPIWVEQSKMQAPDYCAYVEDVGYVPRDIYRHVESNPMGDLPRYSIHIVIQHLMVVASFLILAATGLPLYFSDVGWAPLLMSLFGGPDMARLIHRVGASMMVFSAVYHLLTIGFGTFSKILSGNFDYRRTQIPRLKDLFDLIDDIKYFLGMRAYRPAMDKFMYKQKLHYLAILWGNTVLITAGASLLYPELASQIMPAFLSKFAPDSLITLFRETVAAMAPLPAFFQDFARLMHVDEAIMALIVVAFWHFGNVHLVPGRFPAQWTFLTGRITREHQIEEHFLEYLNNLKEIPEEREYMKKLLEEKGFTRIEISLAELARIH